MIFIIKMYSIVDRGPELVAGRHIAVQGGDLGLAQSRNRKRSERGGPRIGSGDAAKGIESQKSLHVDDGPRPRMRLGAGPGVDHGVGDQGKGPGIVDIKLFVPNFVN